MSAIPAPVLRELSGVSADQFARLVAELGPDWEAARAERLDRPGRKRAQGAGRKHATVFAARLLMVLMYLRWNISYRALGGLFEVSKDSVLRAMNELLPLLADYGITAPDGQRVGSQDDLFGQLERLSAEQRAALVDGTFVPVDRPGGGWDTQKPFYNPHKHTHSRNFQAVTTDRGELLWVGGCAPGGAHDLAALARSEVADTLSDSEITVLGDKAYQGIADRLDLAKAFTPKRRRRKDQATPPPAVTETEKEFNTELARQRVPVEHGIGRLKIRRVLHDFRLAGDRFEKVVRATAALATLPT